MTAIRIVEVGPRDGLQNEAVTLSTADKLTLIQKLIAAGCTEIEATAFVHPKLVPQLADAVAVLAGQENTVARFSVLVPNQKGLERALAAGARAIAIFTAASESFCEKNIGRSIESSLTEYAEVVKTARQHGCWVRGYVSTVTHCPYEGKIPPEQAAQVIAQVAALGCDEVALGETLGRAVPEEIARLLEKTLLHLPASQLAGHFHDTNGRALEHVDVALGFGLTCFDGAVGGLGGCPFAPGAAGNLATEKLALHLAALGYETGLDAVALTDVGRWLRSRLEQRPDPL
ncbi:hydroxymethylglutaryl-CoA lyase [Armatimonas sp.]|uniref:hydroxymethylglutaryl-CoA lyase n=1 Tax=Armatimonas sp. TaxID=1872638 RepID=UPI00286C4D57|nr:hydroxymethylglutaryl-CoA lyase [Armatimonas sp.]